MSAPLTVATLYEALRERFGLSWVAGLASQQKTIQFHSEPDAAPPSLVGHLNFIHPHRIQVLGKTELAYLDNLSKRSRAEVISQIFSTQSDLVIVAGDNPVPEDLAAHAREQGFPLMYSPLPSYKLVGDMQYHLMPYVADSISLHGVFMEVMGIGVLITGDPSIGKSELALELASRGHRLIADDSTVFTRSAPDLIVGRCPEVLQDFLEVRGLGVLNIRAMFGDSAIKHSKYIRLIIHLANMDQQELAEIDRLQGCRTSRTILGVEIPMVTLPVAPGRNLAVLIEVAARNHVLHQKGYNAAEQFIRRQQAHIEKNAQ